MPVSIPEAGGLTAPLAVVLLAREPDAAARCLQALLPGLDAAVPLLAGGTPAGRRALEALCGDHEVLWLDADGAAAWNAAAALAPAADLVLLDGASEVGEGWLETLVGVAAGRPEVATVTAVSNDAAFLSVPRRNLPWPLPPAGATPAEVAERVRAGTLALHPHTPTALPHCALVTRAALQLVGDYDAALTPRDALADFCARGAAAGLMHLVADELFVAYRGEPAAIAVPGVWDGEAAARHPPLTAAIAEAATDRHSRLSRALLACSVVLEPLSVTVDARPLGAVGVTGTTVHLVEVIGALAARDDVRVRALLPSRLGDVADRALAGMGRLERLDAASPVEGTVRTHVVHRPWQIESVQDMVVLDALGERTVLTNQDLIGYRTGSVFPSADRWQDYRRVTRDALSLAAMVVFFSPTAAADALADDLVAPQRTRVVPLGARNERLAPALDAVPPAALGVPTRPFLLVLGNRFRHKNVRFALELLGALRNEHGWDGDLVIAGAEVLHGSGSGDDAAWLLRHPEHAGAVRAVGAVNEAEKGWLLSAASAVVYPTTYEGFGLIPFEAAAAGTPCLFAAVSALRDTLPTELAVLVAWDVRASARATIGILRSEAAGAELVAGIAAAGAPLTWAATADGLVDAYREAVRLPAPPAARLTEDLARAEHAYWSVRDNAHGAVWTLVDPDAQLLDPALAERLSTVLGAPGGRERLLEALADRPGLAARAVRRLRSS
ncbi:glycosyltransferase family 4 protein [Baekduia soli]|uniref:Glycosyltransferase family 4 protein n=1 Tax=Baekduia soli TaxID=496014 RepID=A0A5B8TZW0_9ACTN|nr:glycosyltransferase [Baekduia soli]QEC46245.1 glycosyltransferase family 4 protein [Baekduia soli]